MKNRFEITEGLTRSVSELALLQLTEDELVHFTSQLNKILNYVAHLESLKLDGVEPMFHPNDFDSNEKALETPFREDVVVEFNTSRSELPKILSGAPALAGTGYQVPPIL